MKQKRFVIKNKKKKIALVYRIHSVEAVEMAAKVTHWLLKKNISVFTAPEQKKIARTSMIVSSNELKEMNLIIVLGGDGTYLRAVRLLRNHSVPIIGFNMGSLGFLTTHSQDEVFDMLTMTLKNEMTLDPLTMIRATVKTKSKKITSFDALNDFVIERGSFSQLISTTVYHNKLLVNDIKADGVIISSPTGSTAYNLAAGGPILHPNVKALIITPVAPHSLTSRPLILDCENEITLRLNKQTSTAHFIVDGQKMFELSPEDEVTIQMCNHYHYAIRKPDHSFFSLLKEKLKFGDRYVTGA
jgi:NAD+ kinase